MAVEIQLTRDRQIEQLVRGIGHVIDDAQPEHRESFRQMASDLLDTGNHRFSITDQRDIHRGVPLLNMLRESLVVDSGHELILFLPWIGLALIGAGIIDVRLTRTHPLSWPHTPLLRWSFPPRLP